MKTRDEILWLAGQHVLSDLYAREKYAADTQHKQELREESAHLDTLLNELWIATKGGKRHA